MITFDDVTVSPLLGSNSPDVLYYAKYDGNYVYIKAHLQIKDFDGFSNELSNIIYEKKYAGSAARPADDAQIRTNVNEIKSLYETYKQRIMGIEYENRIYSEIIKVVMDMKLCPNFAEFVGIYESSLAEFMSSFYKINTEDDEFRDQFRKLIIDQGLGLLEWMLWHETIIKKKYKLFSDVLFEWTDLKDLYLKHISIHYLVTKRGTETHNIYNMFLLTDYDRNPDDTNPKHRQSAYSIEDDVLKQIIFQLLYALYVMQEINLQHNYLHYENVLIEKVIPAQKVVYVVRGTVFVVKTKYLVRIINWDMALVDDRYFGKNKVNENLPDRFVKNYDFFMIICDIVRRCSEDQKRKVCTTNIFRNLLAEHISKKFLTLDKYNNIIGFATENSYQYYEPGEFSCTDVPHATLLKFPELSDCLFNPIFNDFRIKSPVTEIPGRLWSCRKRSSRASDSS